MRKMKLLKGLSVALCLTTALAFAGCAGGDDSSAESDVPAAASESSAAPAAASGDEDATILDTLIADVDSNIGEGKTIGIVAFSTGNTWNINAVAGLEDTFAAYGYETEVIDGEYDASKMNAGIDTFITKQVDGIVISGGDQGSLTSGAEKIAASGIPYSCIDMFQEGSVICTMCDNWTGGSEIGIWTLQKIGGKGKVLLLDTPSWVTLKARGDAAAVAFEPFDTGDPKTGIVVERYDIDAGNASADAQEKVAAALVADTGNDIKAILTTWDSPAEGAYAALKESGRTDIVIASADTGKGVMELMREESAPEWVFMGQNATFLAKRAAQGLILNDAGKGDQVPFAVFGPTYFVTAQAEGSEPVLDGSPIKLQTLETHWQEIMGTEYGE